MHLTDLDLENLLKRWPDREPPPEMFATITHRIFQLRRRRFLLRFGWVFAATCVSAFVLAWTWRELVFQAAQTGLGELVSLMLSDTGAIIAHWREFGSSVLESFPAFSVTLFLISLGACLWLARSVIRSAHDWKKIAYSPYLKIL